MPKILVFGIVKSLHDLFTALWVGGILTTAIAFMPTLRKSGLNSSHVNPLMKKYQNHLRVIALISIIGLWLTGILLGNRAPAYNGFFDFSTTYALLISIKHSVILIMVIVAIIRGFVLGRRILDFSPAQKKGYMILLLINSVLGIIVLFLSGISAAMG